MDTSSAWTADGGGCAPTSREWESTVAGAVSSADSGSGK